MKKAEELFEAELSRRGIAFEIDPESGRYAIERTGGRFLVNLDNIAREFERDGEIDRIFRFVDTIQNATPSAGSFVVENVFWALEPSDYEEKADYREAISDRVDRVLVHLSPDIGGITWVSPEILTKLGVSYEVAGQVAYANLSKELSASSIEYSDIDGVRLGRINTKLPFKTALILAPNLREVAGPVLGWPLLAVTPDRDFLYLWDARNSDFTGRVGSVVVREFNEAPYPISTEVFSISDNGIEAIGEFPV